MITFHFRAAADIGTGHARRCAALACALKDVGSDISLVADSATIAFSRQFMPGNCLFVEIDGSPNAVVDMVARQRPSALILDRYDLDVETESALSPYIGNLIVLDDFVGRPHACDILIDQNIGRNATAWKSGLSKEPLILAGSAYALLRPEFAQARSGKRCKPEVPLHGHRIFVCFGGADPHGLIDWLNPAWEKLLNSECSIDIVAGTDTKHLDRIRAYSNTQPNLDLHIASADVANLMAKASIGIGAPGSMTLERACIGLPQVLISFADNQVEVGKLAEEMGVACYLGDWRNLQPEAIAATALDLVGEAGTTEAMAKRACRLVDGRGTRRAATAIFPETTGNGDPIRLRPMDEADAEIVFQWQNADGMRRHFRDPEKIAWEDHRAWTVDRLRNYPLETYIAYDRGYQPVGLLHLKRHEEKGWWVSILVAPEAQGKGAGLAMLRQVGRIYWNETLYAEIKRENAASIKTFQAADFVDTGDVFIRKPTAEIVR